MKKIKFNKLTALFLGLLLVLGSVPLANAVSDSSFSFLKGQSYKESVIKKPGKDKIVARYDGNKIYASEVDYLKWQYDNSPEEFKPDYNDAYIIRKIARRKIILDEAKKYNIALDKAKIDQIQKQQLEAFDKNPEKNQAFIDGAGMTKEEISKMLAENYINTLIYSKYMAEKFAPMIMENKLKTDNQELLIKAAELKKSVEERKANPDLNNTTVSLLDLLDLYADSLLEDAKFKILK